MHKLVIGARIGAALAFAAPATAQYYPAPVAPPGYSSRMVFGDGWEQIRALRFRIEAIRHQIDALDRHDAIGGHAADRLLNDANRIDRRLRDRVRRGLDGRDAADIEYRLQRLEQQVQLVRGRRAERFGDWG